MWVVTTNAMEFIYNTMTEQFITVRMRCNMHNLSLFLTAPVGWVFSFDNQVCTKYVDLNVITVSHASYNDK